jgi:glycosyltransferase involved in cell wall biosynthesis
VDATPPEQRDETKYDPSKYDFKLDVLWQQTKGSCRARNEAIERCVGEYIVFGDDDIRLKDDFIESHIRFMQTNKTDASAGLDVQADHPKQGISDLLEKLELMGSKRWLGGPAQKMTNSNACVKRDIVNKIGGNDINFDGGYGEDGDFGFSLLEEGVILKDNPYAANLHLKPGMGGYRVWGKQAKVTGKKRKKQPWELDHPVKWLRPVPSPTVMYLFLKHFGVDLIAEYRHKYFFLFLFKGPKLSFVKRLLQLPYRQLQFNKSLFYAKNLVSLGKRFK